MNDAFSMRRRLRHVVYVLLLLVAAASDADAQRFAAPATALSVAAPTGAAELAILVHWLHTDVTELYGFAFRSQSAVRPVHMQFAFGQPRGVGANWVAAVSVDAGRRLTAPGGMTNAYAFTGAQLLFDREDEAFHARVPLAVRGESGTRLGENALLAGVMAGGASLGLTQFEGTTGYGGVFAEGGLRTEVYGFWLQGTVGIDRRVLGSPAASDVDPRFTIRFGYRRPRPDQN